VRGILWIMVISMGILEGGVMDDIHLYMAKHYSNAKSYDKALHHYTKIDSTDSLLYQHRGDMLYRLGQYQEAINSYMQIESPSMMHTKFYDIANCLIAMGELKKAIVFYKNALKFDNHSDTIYNLKLAQKEYKKLQETEAIKAQKDANENIALRKGSERIDEFREDNGTDDLIDAPPPKYIAKNSNIVATPNHRTEDKVELSISDEQNISSSKLGREEYEQIEESRWEHILKTQKLNTLLIPLNILGEDDDKTLY